MARRCRSASGCWWRLTLREVESAGAYRERVHRFGVLLRGRLGLLHKPSARGNDRRAIRPPPRLHEADRAGRRVRLYRRCTGVDGSVARKTTFVEGVHARYAAGSLAGGSGDMVPSTAQETLQVAMVYQNISHSATHSTASMHPKGLQYMSHFFDWS